MRWPAAAYRHLPGNAECQAPVTVTSNWVIKAELLENYKIYIEFNDGLKGVIDFKNKLMTDHREIIRELLDNVGAWVTGTQIA